MKAFRAPKTSFGNLDAEATGALLTAAADIAIVLDARGTIRDVAFNNEELALELEGRTTWLGRPWVETVKEDSRTKVDTILAEVRGGAEARWRHVNQTSAKGGSVPILYSAARLGAQGRVAIFGRDLRPIADLQQRLVEAQRSIERDYSKLRHAETRYRLLFQMAAEPVMVLDAGSGRVLEANPAAQELLGATPTPETRRGAPRAFLDLFVPEARPPVTALLAAVRAAGRADEIRARLADDGRDALVSASMFRQDNASLLLLRLAFPENEAGAIVLPKARTKLLKAAEAAPDAFVVADEDGLVLAANAAFVEMAQLASEDQARGESLDRWLGRPGVDFEVLASNLRKSGTIRLFATTMRGEHGANAAVELSAVAVMNGVGRCYGFNIRDVGPRPAAAPREGQVHARSVDQLTELIGRVPLKDLVREATDQIERLCIEAALQITGDNRASAAEMLGLSRQSLYVKLRRYGMGDLGGELGGDIGPGPEGG